MNPSLRSLRQAALIAIGVLVTAASVTSFAESYRSLFLWAGEHGLHGIWAAGFPLQVDVFVAVGELALFVALADRWPVRSRVAAWGVTVAGLAVSVAGNVGHIEVHSAAARATAAVPPIAAAAALAVGLGVLKRVVAAHDPDAPEQAPETPLALAPATAVVSASASAPALNGKAHPSAPGRRIRDRSRARTRSAPVTASDAEREFMTDITSGAVPSLRQIRSRLHVGQDRARVLREHLETVTTRT